MPRMVGRSISTLASGLIGISPGFAKGKLAPYELPKEIGIRKELPQTNVGTLDIQQLWQNQ